jgi:hypothetical protein
MQDPPPAPGNTGEDPLARAARLMLEARDLRARIRELVEANLVLRGKLQETRAELADLIARSAEHAMKPFKGQ